MTLLVHYRRQYLDLGIIYQRPFLEDDDEVSCHAAHPTQSPLSLSPPPSPPHTHMHAHTHTHTCTCTHTHTCTEIHTYIHTHTHRHTHSGFVSSSPSCCDCDEINMHMSVFLPASQIVFRSFLLPFSLSSWINTSSKSTFVSAMLVGLKKDKKECGVSQTTSSIFVSILRSSSVFVLFTVSTMFLSPWHWKFFKVQVFLKWVSPSYNRCQCSAPPPGLGWASEWQLSHSLRDSGGPEMWDSPF